MRPGPGLIRTEVLIAHDRANRDNFVAALRSIRRSLPAVWERHVDDGVAINLAPLRDLIPDRVLRKSLAEIAKSAGRGELGWSQTYQKARKTQVRIELRMRSISEALPAFETPVVPSVQVNSAPMRKAPPAIVRQ